MQRTRARGGSGAPVEYAALLARLEARLHLAGEAEALRRAEALEMAMRQLDEELTDAEDALEERFAALSARLLGRWPMLDDAYHPDFAPTLETDRSAITGALESWPEARAFWAAQHALDQLDARYQLSVAEYEAVEQFRVDRIDCGEYEISSEEMFGDVYEHQYRNQGRLTFTGMKEYYRQYAWS